MTGPHGQPGEALAAKARKSVATRKATSPIAPVDGSLR